MSPSLVLQRAHGAKRAIAPRSSAPRRVVAAATRLTAAGLFVALLPTAAGATPATPAQTVGSLQAEAQRIAAQLDDLDRRTNDLDEQYNDASLQLEKLRKQVDENRAELDAAQKQLDARRSRAQAVAIQAYTGTGDDTSFAGLSDDSAEASRRKTYLASQFGDSADAIDGLVSSQKDLADKKAALDTASAKVDAKVAEIQKAKSELESTISDREALFDSVKGKLADALKAEQERRAREAQAQAEAQARAAAARAAAAQRPQAVVVRANAAPGGARTAVVATAPPARAATPPPPGAPTAVQVAPAQQGDPYRWAAAGPDAFDCSGLVMFAYRAAGRSLPHSSRSLRAMTRSISADELQPGDLVFGGSPVHHVGIYIGDGQMVHAPHSGDVVRVASIYSTSKPVSFGRL